jgi:voltage-gated potassium channel
MPLLQRRVTEWQAILPEYVMNQSARNQKVPREQYHVLRQVEDWLEIPMFVLSIVWVALLVVELTWGTGPLLQNLVTVIWIVFVLEFVLKFVIAPKKVPYLRRNWLTFLALILPALRVFRVARVVYVLRMGRAIRGLTLARVLTAFNRGLRSLQRTVGQYGFGYLVTLTILVTILGAAAMYAFERHANGGLKTFGDALWFTAMLMTTSGSDYWPKTMEGRTLCFLLALYAFAIFGYVTAILATLLVGREVKVGAFGAADARAIAALRAEITDLKERLARGVS